LAELSPNNTHIFYDDVHFNVGGCEFVAQVLVFCPINE
jgi:hypothetical protein